MFALLIALTLLILALNINTKPRWLQPRKEYQHKEEVGYPISLQTVDVYVDGVYSHTERRT